MSESVLPLMEKNGQHHSDEFISARNASPQYNVTGVAKASLERRFATFTTISAKKKIR